MKRAELHQAFVWDCDECGRENLERVLLCESPSAWEDIQEEGSGAYFTEAVDTEKSEDDISTDKFLISIPEYIECRHCQEKFICTLATGELGDEDQLDDDS